MADEFRHSSTARGTMCGLEKGFTSLHKHSHIVLSSFCLFCWTKVTWTNPIKRDNYFSAPISHFCNYAVPNFWLKRV